MRYWKRHFSRQGSQLVGLLYGGVCSRVTNTTKQTLMQLVWDVLPNIVFGPMLPLDTLFWIQCPLSSTTLWKLNLQWDYL